MKKHTAPDGTKIYTPRKKPSPSGQTNIITDPAITHSTWLGKWFSACDFELKRIK